MYMSEIYISCGCRGNPQSVRRFDWDEANVDKNWKTHRVHFWECEELFFNEPIVAERDAEHTAKEKRFYSLGKTSANRLLFVVFTVRNKVIRVVSARDMTRSEKLAYGRYEEKNSGF